VDFAGRARRVLGFREELEFMAAVGVAMTLDPGAQPHAAVGRQRADLVNLVGDVDQAHQADDELRVRQQRDVQRHGEHVRIGDRQGAVLTEAANLSVARQVTAARCRHLHAGLEARHGLALGNAPLSEHGHR
jgi:hypothetical protein